MASVLFFSLLLFLSLPSVTLPQSPDQPTAASVPPEIHQACKATRFPIPCENALTQSKRVASNPTSLQLIQAAISVSSDKLHIIQSMVKSILESSAGSQNRTIAAKSCVDLLHNCDYRLRTASEALPHGRVKDARAWTSAALQFQYDCWATLNRTADTKMVNETITLFDPITKLTSNAISMVFAYDVYGKDTKSWAPPKTERDGLWERNEAGGGGGSTASFKGGVPKNLKADVTVCKDATKGGGCYKTVQEAVNAAPDNGGKRRRFVIYIKEGVYEETVRIPLEKKNVVFLGDGMGKTVITGSLNVGQLGISTYGSATVGVTGDGFMAAWLTIQNTAGPDAHQAVAFRSDSDLSVIENCEFLGNQDTLYSHTLRQFYKSCRIQGNVDFICGNSAAVFQDSQILVRPRQVDPEKGESNAVTAHGRNDPAQATGFVFQNCVINGTNEYMALYHKNPQVHNSYLGRPWKEYSRTIFVNSNIESLITPEGWMPWSGDVGLKTLYYGEAGNSGPGSNLSKRVTWSSQIPAEHIYTYSAHNFIQGNEWIPSS